MTQVLESSFEVEDGRHDPVYDRGIPRRRYKYFRITTPCFGIRKEGPLKRSLAGFIDPYPRRVPRASYP